MRGPLFLLLLLALFFPPLQADAGPGNPLGPGSSESEIQDLLRNKEIRLSLNAALQIALRNNLEIAIQRAEPGISEQKLVQEKAVFDPSVSLTVSKDRSLQQTSSTFASPPENVSEDINVEAGISDKLVTGAETGLRFTDGRNETNSVFAGLNPSYNSELILSLTQPLLKDFGIGTNMARIRVAANNKEISGFQFEENVMEVLSNVESTYWELFYTMEELKVQEESLRLAEDFLELTRRKAEVGVLPPVEVLQAEAEKAAREEGVIRAEDALRDAEDTLRRVLNLSDAPGYWEVRLVPSDEPVLTQDPNGLEEHLQTALTRRPDLNQAKLNLESKKIQLKYSRNQLLPRVDLVGALGVSGLSGKAQSQPDLSNPGATLQNPFGGNNSDSLDELTSGDHYSYSIGIQVAYPLGNRAARSEKVMADLERQKALFSLKDLENRVVQEVREAFRQIGTNRKRIAAAEAARKLSEERLRAETRRYEVGLATSHDVLDYQERLSVAKSSELRARIDYRESLVNLERVKGTLLQSKGIVL